MKSRFFTFLLATMALVMNTAIQTRAAEAYSQDYQKNFMLRGSENSHSIPWWVVACIILFIARTGYFVISSLSVKR